MDGAPELVHGTAIAIPAAAGAVGGDAGWRAALIRGPSGAGKSDLALRCLAMPANALVPAAARLVADDQVVVTRRDGRLEVSPPAAIRGLIEVRGLGIVAVGCVERAELTLIVDLVARDQVPRLADPSARGNLLAVALPAVALHAFDPSTALKLLIALREPPTT